MKMNKPVRHEDALYRTVDQVMKETNMSRGKVMQVANEADSLIRVGRLVRINAEKFYKYLNMEYGC